MTSMVLEHALYAKIQKSFSRRLTGAPAGPDAGIANEEGGCLVERAGEGWGGEGDANARPRCGRDRKRARERRGAIGSDDRSNDRREGSNRRRSSIIAMMTGWAICGRGHEHPRVWDDS
jgi:hypothetical protein